MSEISVNLGEKIRTRRRALNLTLEELAVKIGTTKSYIWELENKPKSRPSAEKIFKLAMALNVSAEYFLDEASKNSGMVVVDSALFRRIKALDPEDLKIVESIIERFEEKRTAQPQSVGQSPDKDLASSGAASESKP